MAGIAAAGLCLGTLANRLGRRRTIVIGFTAFAAASFLFAVGKTFLYFVVLMGLSGLAIGVFKTRALALVGDISTSTTEHTSIMNTVEGFFSVGSIVGPAVLAYLLAHGVSWQWLYIIAGAMCVVLIVTALSVDLSEVDESSSRSWSPEEERLMTRQDPYVLAFSAGVFLYVGVEAAIYVWMPTLFASYRGHATWLAASGISIFFALRAVGRFLGAWMLHAVGGGRPTVAVLSGAYSGVFRVERGRGRGMGGVSAARFRSLHGRDLSDAQFERHQLRAEERSTAPRPASSSFFTCPLRGNSPARNGRVERRHWTRSTYGFWLATGLAALLCAGLLLNWLVNPTDSVLARVDAADYRQESSV